MPRRRKGGKNTLLITAAAAVTVVIGVLILVWLSGKPPKDTREIDVYFSDEEGLYLKAEKRSIDKGPLLAEAREALGELIEGPESAQFASALPSGTKLLGLRIDDKTATVDLSREVVENHPGGSSFEIQTVYSVVNTLALNFPEIEDVQILVEGKKTDTIAGHIDVTLPLGPDHKIIRN
ncbi:MAG: GerMN domain-containing protein [Deltaproteobacteria bacterium]|nr:GerMN domain-containing protein [Deltaproteobacteria bacterium]MBZ0219202.1 GerMN domain-containing protein [Deltaproteobacteria bacterium]